MKVLKIIGVLISIGLYLFWGWFTLDSLSGKKFHERKYVKCGTVKNKVNETNGDGEYVKTKMYLGIQFDDGTFEAEEFGPTTFLEKDKGDRICLNYYKDLTKLQTANNLLFFGSFISLIMFGMSKLTDL